MKKSAFLLILVAILLCHSLTLADSFRCGNEIVHTGDSALTVIMKCGKPEFRETESTSISGSGRTNFEVTRRRGRPMVTARSRRSATCSDVEKWLYCIKDSGYYGGHTYCYELTFKEGKLTEIERLDRKN